MAVGGKQYAVTKPTNILHTHAIPRVDNQPPAATVLAVEAAVLFRGRAVHRSLDELGTRCAPPVVLAVV